MRKFVATVLFISLTAIPHVTFTQKNSTANVDTQRRAERIADRFVERFQQTLDFGIVWKEFRLSDPSCTHRANLILSENDYAKLRLNGDIIEKLYIATMNLYYLNAVYDLSRIDSRSEDASATAEIEVIEKGRSSFRTMIASHRGNVSLASVILIAKMLREFGVPYGNRTRVAAVKEKRFTGIQRKPAAWIAL